MSVCVCFVAGYITVDQTMFCLSVFSYVAVVCFCQYQHQAVMGSSYLKVV